ncbi:MAG: trehalose-6-phosphate synthase [Pseudomonadota bacterium]
MTADSGRLIIVSNRMGDPGKPPKGGLAVALNGALNAVGGIWLGWSGKIGATTGTTSERQVGSVKLVGIDLTQRDYEGYYLGYANSVLWPAFHHRQDLIDQHPEHFEAYCRVNRAFAEKLAKLVKPQDTIWVHDYHLLCVAMELRSMGVNNSIGFFLHIPLPPSQIMSAVPNNELLMRALMHFDLVGLQTEADVLNFRLYAERNLGVELDNPDTVTAFGRTARVEAFPIGIDVDQFRALLETDYSTELVGRLGRSSSGRVLVTGVDRLDYSKGLPDRLKVFDRLLEKYPANQRETTLVQIASPTRENVDAYADIRAELEGLSGAINGKHGRIDWTPIRYIHRNVPRSRLAGLFSISRVGLVTPLRDGMNLVAKEYVAVQSDEDPGVLVLSQFAGAAEEMEEAVIVNPHDIEQTADCLQRALVMPLEERRERHQALKARVETGNVVTWCETFLARLQSV